MWQNHGKFRFVTLPQEIPDKMKLHPWKFQNLCYTLCKIQGLYPRLVEIPHDFLFDHSCKFLFLAPGIYTFYFENPCPQPPPSPPVLFFFWNHLHSYTDSYISSFWWVVNILLQKFDTLSKSKVWPKKQHSYLYCELAPLTCDVTCLKL